MSLLDTLITQFDYGLRSLTGQRLPAEREDPANNIPEAELTATEKKHIAGLMRVNHTGEICAQALYQGQAMTARDKATAQHMQLAAEEEIDHLNWTTTRLEQLNSRPSLFNPLWYIGSLSIGVFAGLLGDRVNLGFVAETERQVVKHLDKHLQRLPASDHRSRKILSQMREDESKHASMAVTAGGKELPTIIKGLMRLTSKVMTTVAYRL